MLLPTGTAVYSNLSTSFTNLRKLLKELEANRHPGLVSLHAWDFEGVLFLDLGKIVNAWVKAPRLTGWAAAEKIFEKAAEQDGFIDVLALPADVVTALVSVLEVEGEVPLSGDQGFEVLMQELQSQALTGYAELEFTSPLPKGCPNGLLRGIPTRRAMVILHEGRPVEAVVETEDGSRAHGLQSLEKTWQKHAPVRQGVVYHCNLEASFAAASEIANRLAVQEVTDVVGGLMALIETTLDSQFQEGLFHKTFLSTQRSLAKSYAFHDPQSGELRYAGGKLHVHSAVSLSDFIEGLRLCLVKTLEEISVELSNVDVIEALDRAVRPFLDRRSEDIAKFQLKECMPEIFG